MIRLLAVLLIFALGVTPVMAQDAESGGFTKAQKAAIEDIIKNYLTKENPSVVMDAMREMQKRDQASAEAKSAEMIKTNKDKIYNDPTTPVGGNAKGDVTIVEYFDDQCGYCKMSESYLEKLVQDDGNIRFIYKEFPVLGPASITASKVSLAAFKEYGIDKYVKLHEALMNKKEHLSDDIVYDTAKDQGLDVDKLKKDVSDSAMEKQIQAGLDLGTTIGVRGTPFFIIGDKTYPGAFTQYDQIKKAVDAARAVKKG